MRLVNHLPLETVILWGSGAGEAAGCGSEILKPCVALRRVRRLRNQLLDMPEKEVVFV